MKDIRLGATTAAVLAAFAIVGCTAQPADLDTSKSPIAPISSEIVTPTTKPSSASTSESASTGVASPTSDSASTPAPTPESTPAPAPQPDELSPTTEPSTEYQEPATTEAEQSEWIDPAGNWMSPGTVQRALDHGIPWGDFVPGYLRCGTICGEIPTSGEVQSEYWATHQQEPTTQAEEPWEDCTPPQYWINGTCYPSAAAASAAGENVGD